MKLLTPMAANPKTAKGLPGSNYYGALLHLSHANTSGLINVCADAELNECIKPCLDNEGRGHTPDVKLARLARTAMLATQRAAFFAKLREEITAVDLRAAAEQKQGLIRLDATSDLGYAQQLCREWPRLIFFDYTKSFQRVRRHLAAVKRGREQNYYLTFSLGAANMEHALQCLQWGVNVSVVFRARKGDPIPERWNGYDVFDGDKTDWRFEDPHPSWIGLRSKGSSYNAEGRFIQANPAVRKAA